jgi:hypothetical protein
MVDNDAPKIISISGTNNKYHMKKLVNENKNEYENKKEVKKRVKTENWTFLNETFVFSDQIKIIYDIFNNNFKFINDNEISKTAIQEINKKISGYKQQDKIKGRLDETKFLTYESVITKMVECELKCRYCLKEMYILYDISRESRQWSVDRVDNNLGHNIDNYHLACLECNLKRRRRTDEKFLFTKQLNIIKQDFSL